MSSLDVSSVSLQLQTQQSTHCTLRKNTPTYGPNSPVDSTLNSRNEHSHRGGAWGGICNFSTSKIDWNVSKIQSAGEGNGGGLPCHCWGAWVGREGGRQSPLRCCEVGRTVRGRSGRYWGCYWALGQGNSEVMVNTAEELCKCCIVLLSLPL